MGWIGVILLLLLFLLLLTLWLPLRFHVEVEHRQTWQGMLTLSLLWWEHTMTFDNAQCSGLAPSFEKIEEALEERMERTSFQIHWRSAAIYFSKVLQIISKHIHVERYELRCIIGCLRPDCTAYLYGLFWTILSAVPQHWLEQGNVSYLPDFQQKRQDVFFQGIICCRIGQLMYIIAALFWLTAVSIHKQQKQEQPITREYGEEQMVYES